jgi:protein-S-isoprenylcysteine O-methyltransferase Ste14
MSLATPRPTDGGLGLGSVQRRRRLALLVGALVATLAIPFTESSGEEGLAHETLEMLGVLFIAIGILGRAWCTLYIGSRKGTEVVATGPYSVSRNPLYLFSFIAVAGIGAQTGSYLVTALLVAVAVLIFLPAILREETALATRFGEEYERYRSRVPRFGPRFTAWTDMETIVVTPRLFWKTAREGLFFFLVIPYCEGIEWLQAAGYIEPLVRLP